MKNDEADLEKLLASFPPPAPPRFAEESVFWRDTKAKLGGWLPDFIPMFARRYGSGEFQDANGAWLRLYNPYAPDYLKAITQSSQIFNDVYSEVVNFPYNCYPAPGGLYPIGSISGGEELYVLYDTEEIGYRIVHNERTDFHDPSCHRVYPAKSFFEFLHGFLRNELQDSEYFSTLPRFVRDEPVEPLPEDDPIRLMFDINMEFRFPGSESD
jgi:hypothetical protein